MNAPNDKDVVYLVCAFCGARTRMPRGKAPLDGQCIGCNGPVRREEAK